MGDGDTAGQNTEIEKSKPLSSFLSELKNRPDLVDNIPVGILDQYLEPAQEAIVEADGKISRLEKQHTRLELLDSIGSVFQIFPSTELPSRITENQNTTSEITEADRILRQNLENKFETLPENKNGRDLLIQSLGYSHIIHNNVSLLKKGFDVYNNFNPEQTENISDTRVLEVASHNLEQTIQARQTLENSGVGNLKGYALNYDAHSSDYLSSNAVDNTFPRIEQLKELGVNRLVFIGEFSPTVENNISQQIKDDSYTPDSHLIDFIQKCQQNGIEIVVWGIDTRYETQNKITTIKLEDGTGVIFGGYDSNPRVRTTNGTLMRLLGGKVEVSSPTDNIGRFATEEESSYYYNSIQKAESRK